MTKALMRMMRRTTLPTTETSNTVELAPSPIMGAGTGKMGERSGELSEGRNKEREEDNIKSTRLRSIESAHMKEPAYTVCH